MGGTFHTSETDRPRAAAPRTGLSRWFSSAPGMKLSTRLMLIIATCLIPTIGLQVAVGISQWHERKKELGKLAIHQAELLAGDMASISEGGRILLSTAAEFRQVRTHDHECSVRLASIRRNVPSFAFVVLLDGHSGVRCASDPVVATTPASARWIQDAAGVHGFTAGRFDRSPEHPGGFLPFYLPLQSPGADRDGTLVAALDLTWLSQHLFQLRQTSSTFLSGGVLTIADADGVILGRNPQHAEFVGRRFPPAAMPAVRDTQPGVLRLKSIDGTERLVGYVPPTPASHNLSIVVGFFEPDLMGDIGRALTRSAIMLAGISLVAFVLTLLVARRFITRPTRDLLAATRRWREGDLATRAPHADERSEFGQIAAACNEMAAALARREEELREHADALEARVAERTRELLVTNNRLQVEIEERHNTEAALLQSQKLQAVGQLAGGIAHDFNNLLATIQGNLDMLGQSIGPQQSKQRTWIERASGAISRGAQLTRRLLAFSRRRRLAVQSTDVNQLINDLVVLFGAATLGNRIRITCTTAADLWPAMAEPSQVEAAVLNLALNARDAMPDGGMLTLTTRNEVLTEPTDGLPAGEYVGITVADTGAGMTEQVARRALEPFFTTKGSSGSGLGLSQVHAMVQESGGAIRIRTAPGQGTAITLLLPRAEPVGPAVDQPTPARRDRPRQTVLVVDDDPQVLEVTCDMLRQLGYCVTRATSGQEALASLPRAEALPGLAILDFAMPGMNGLALAAILRERGFTGPIVLATGYADLSEIGCAEQGALQAVLNKPYTFQELEQTLSRVEDAMTARTAFSVIEAAR